MPQQSVNGATFNYVQAGQGPDVVLIHAVTGNLSVWMFIGLIDTLVRAGFRVTAYDLRGHGLSEATPAGYTSAEMARDFHELHAALGLGRAYLVGHSFGAVVAVHAAVLNPECVAGLVLADPYFPGLAHIEPNMARSNVWRDLREHFRHAGIELGEAVDFTRLFQAVAGLRGEQKAALRQRMGAASERWLMQLPRLAETTCGADVFAEAGLTAEEIVSVGVPVVALYDEHSPFLATCRYLEQRLRHCVVEIVPEAGHLGPVQNPAAFVELVRKHLVRLLGLGSEERTNHRVTEGTE
jgi:pimeloyl-ACP methyl ester carboxylesterase